MPLIEWEKGDRTINGSTTFGDLKLYDLFIEVSEYIPCHLLEENSCMRIYQKTTPDGKRRVFAYTGDVKLKIHTGCPTQVRIDTKVYKVTLEKIALNIEI